MFAVPQINMSGSICLTGVLNVSDIQRDDSFMA